MSEIGYLSEHRMAEKLGLTYRALVRRRQRNVIPESVWIKHHGRILYSVERYEKWLDSLWSGRQESSQSVKKSASGSLGTASADAKPSSTRKLHPASRLPPVSVLR